MPRYTTSQTYTDGNTQIVALPDSELELSTVVLAPAEAGGATASIEDEDIEVKLRRISEQVPVRISNTSGSSAGSGSGDFHQVLLFLLYDVPCSAFEITKYRQMRRREQDRLARMEIDYEKRKEEAEFLARRESRIKEAEERTAKKRAKRQKKKEKRRQKRNRSEAIIGQDGQQNIISDEENSEDTGSEAEDSMKLPPYVKKR